MLPLTICCTSDFDFDEDHKKVTIQKRNVLHAEKLPETLVVHLNRFRLNFGNV
jgi:hypothetical protein